MKISGELESVCGPRVMGNHRESDASINENADYPSIDYRGKKDKQNEIILGVEINLMPL